MSARRKFTGNLLFWFQIICAIIFSGAQVLRMLENTQGVSISFFLCHDIFALLNLWLSVIALRESVDGERKIKKQSVYVYAMWTLFITIHLVVALSRMPQPWKYPDTITVLIVLLGTLAIVSIAKIKRIPFLDPYIKAAIAIFFKSVPQLSLAYTIYLYGEGGLSGIWILFGNITIITRIGHLWISEHKQWNRNTKGSLISEIWNEGSWLVASISWLIF